MSMTHQEAAKLPEIGKLKNNWRERTVSVRQHPTDPQKVVSIGVPFGGGAPIVCEEGADGYAREIAMYPLTCDYN
jgi:cephalosporin-C deacetylase-like acetyl esterase